MKSTVLLFGFSALFLALMFAGLSEQHDNLIFAFWALIFGGLGLAILKKAE